jgi:hypothetical protein
MEPEIGLRNGRQRIGNTCREVVVVTSGDGCHSDRRNVLLRGFILR